MNFEIQRASILKRISAFILDAIILCIAITGVMFVASAITDYDGYARRLDESYAEYAAQHGIESFDISEEDYSALSDEEKANYDAAYKALVSDDEVMRNYSMMLTLSLLIVSLGVFFATVLLEFVLPLILKNGQTVGKKIFGLGVMRCDGVKISTFMLFVRSFIGKFTIELMVPIMIVMMMLFGNGIGTMGVIVILLMFVFQIILLFATKNRTVIHDAFAQTVVVDLPSQMIFDSSEALLAYQERVAAERAARAEYR